MKTPQWLVDFYRKWWAGKEAGPQLWKLGENATKPIPEMMAEAQRELDARYHEQVRQRLGPNPHAGEGRPMTPAELHAYWEDGVRNPWGPGTGPNPNPYLGEEIPRYVGPDPGGVLVINHVEVEAAKVRAAFEDQLVAVRRSKEPTRKPGTRKNRMTRLPIKARKALKKAKKRK